MKPPICIPLLAAMSLTACATITRGDSERIAFESIPQGASVSTTTGVQCTTPCDANVKRNEDFVATFTHNGRVKTVKVEGEGSSEGVATGVVGNAVFGGLIGLAIDAGTGAMMDHTPNPVHASFDGSDTSQCEKGSPPMVGGTSYCF